MILPMENTEKMIFHGVGKYGIPEIKPETDIRIDKLEWIPVNYALTAKDKATKGVHMSKEISAGSYKIRGSSGVFRIYDGSKQIGGASKLSDAKAFVEVWRKKKR